MKRMILKGSTMVFLIVVIALASAAWSNAQSAPMVVSNIPFDFIVGDKTMPAGEYRLSQTFLSSLAIQSSDARTSAVRLTNVLEPRKGKTQARLVFHRYGQSYFLKEVWEGGESIGRQLIRSRQERAIQRELKLIAARGQAAEESYEVVEVAALYR